MLYFTSDTHWGHKNIIKYCSRPFSSIEEHDEGLILNWNSMVTDKDDVYHLGDFAFATEEYVISILKRLKGKIHFVCGNHDKVVKNSSKIKSMLASYQEYVELKVPTPNGKKHIVLFHFPIESWHKKHYGSYHLHGHVHGSMVKTESNSNLRVDVGVDVWNYYPVSVSEIIHHMSAKTFISHTK